MGALPKNKITRAERGKRRAGNTPTITKDPNKNSIPRHKRGFVAQLFRVLGMDGGPAKKVEKTAEKGKKSSTTASTAQKPELKASAPQGKTAGATKVARITQHKG